DGQTIVYNAAWDRPGPYELYTTRPGSLESRPLGIRGGLLSISSEGQMAVFLPDGTLAPAPLAGGAPRELLKRTQWADWTPNGKDLAVIHRVEGKARLELPIGRI